VPTRPTPELETVANPAPERAYTVRMVSHEFTCLCPRTGQPDFASLVVEYQPAAVLVELKGLKLYLWSWRDRGAFHEEVVNRIVDDVAAAAAPRWLRVTGFFRIRGGITTTVTASTGEAPADLPGETTPPRPGE
jgi:7-cyano-7-deazaguanine reductase